MGHTERNIILRLIGNASKMAVLYTVQLRTLQNFTDIWLLQLTSPPKRRCLLLMA